MIGSGLLIAFRIPPGSQGGHGVLIAGLRRHEWGDIHLYISYAFIVLAIAHLALHWHWLVKVAGQGSPIRIWMGLAAGLLVVLSFLVVK
jgi:hypothetical protein